MSARSVLSGRWRLHPSNHQGRPCAQSRCRGLSDCRRALHSVNGDPWIIDSISVNANGGYGAVSDAPAHSFKRPRALYCWGNGLRAWCELTTLAPIMWQHSLNVVWPLKSQVASTAFECRCMPRVR
jgi:hypothetical protein